MDKYLNNIKNLIDKNIVFERKTNILKERNRLNTYFDIGREITMAIGNNKPEYGTELLKVYANELKNIYGKGYDYSNLYRMKQLYETYKIFGTVCQKLSWSHYRYILPIKEEGKRNYYINLAIKNTLSVRELKDAIKSNSYERLTKEDKKNIQLINDNSKLSIIDMIKDPIIINCSNKNLDKYSERALRELLLEDIEKTLLELGVGFSYVGKEKRIKVGDNYRFIDLVFFNIELNCYILFELKIKKIDIRDIGQIEFYVNYYDDNIRKSFHDETIGIIICNKNDKEVTKYINNDRLLVTTYKIN
ncbi:MAG: DUF1016 family protein [Bacilli bacterium]|nr:DUF1016 family protein [Bacilli bacterium]